MVESFPFVLLQGTALGFLSGVGIGGGSLLILWLTLVLEMPQAQARSINLLFFIPSALIASFFHKQQGRLQLRMILPAILSGCIAAAIGSWLGILLDTALLKRLFGGLLLLTGIREILYKPKEKGS